MSARMAHRALVLAIALALMGGVAWGGSTQAAPLHALMVVASVALTTAWLARPRLGPVGATAMQGLLALLFVVTLLMLCPIPISLYGALQPRAALARTHVLPWLPAWRPITDDIGATVLVAGRLAALLGLGVATLSLARDSQRWLPRLLVLTLASAVALAVASVFGVALPAPLFAAEPTRAWVRSPLQNPNHLGALVGALLPIAWAALYRTRAASRLALAVLIAGANAILWATHSRGALFGGVVGQLATLLWLRSHESGRWRALRRAAGTTLVVATAVGLVMEIVLRGNSVTAASRLVAWGDALALVRDHLFFGVGPGAFALVFPRYSTVAGHVNHAFIENQYLQLVLDFGVPLAVCISSIALVIVVRVAGRVDLTSLTRKAAIIGLMVLALHDAADFASWGGAIATVAVSLLALATTGLERRVGRATLVALIVAPVALFAASFAWSTPKESEAQLAHAIVVDDPEAIDASGLAALGHHPEDSELALLTCGRLVELGAPQTARWVERSLQLAPLDPRSHIFAAWALGRGGFRKQAAAELRTAATAIGDRDRVLLGNAASTLFADEPELLARALPPDDARLVTGVVDDLVRGGRDAEARIVLDGLASQLESPDRALLALRISVGMRLDEHGTLVPFLKRYAATTLTPPEQLFVARAWTQAGRPQSAEVELRAVLTLGNDAERASAAVALSSLLADRDLKASRDIVELARARAVDASAKVDLLRQLAALDDRAGRTALAAVERAEAAQLLR